LEPQEPRARAAVNVELRRLRPAQDRERVNEQVQGAESLQNSMLSTACRLQV